jgi:mannitol-specific phosphotransferase system IIBC component
LAGAAAPLAPEIGGCRAGQDWTTIEEPIKMAQSISAAQVKSIIFACEAGMGSSLMSVNSLKKKLKAAQITDIVVVHKPAREIPADAQLVIVHKGLAKTARAKAPQAVVLAFNHFLNDPVFDKLIKALVEKTDIIATEA